MILCWNYPYILPSRILLTISNISMILVLCRSIEISVIVPTIHSIINILRSCPRLCVDYRGTHLVGLYLIINVSHSLRFDVGFGLLSRSWIPLRACIWLAELRVHLASERVRILPRRRNRLPMQRLHHPSNFDFIVCHIVKWWTLGMIFNVYSFYMADASAAR